MKYSIEIERKDFIPELNLENLVRLINTWEEDRCGLSEECIFDLEDVKDFNILVSTIGLKETISLYNTGMRYWWGGCAYEYRFEYVNFISHHRMRDYNGNTDGIMTPIVLDDKTLNWIIGEVNDRLELYAKRDMLKAFNAIYGKFFKVDENITMLERVISFADEKFNKTINDVEGIEEDDIWELYYLTFVDNTNNVVLYHKPSKSFYYTIDDAYPCHLEDLYMYRWTKDGTNIIFMGYKSLNLLPYSTTLYDRLLFLNHKTIDGCFVDGVGLTCVPISDRIMGFVNNANKQTYRAYYDSPMSIVPTRISKDVSWG